MGRVSHLHRGQPLWGSGEGFSHPELPSDTKTVPAWAGQRTATQTQTPVQARAQAQVHVQPLRLRLRPMQAEQPHFLDFIHHVYPGPSPTPASPALASAPPTPPPPPPTCLARALSSILTPPTNAPTSVVGLSSLPAAGHTLPQPRGVGCPACGAVPSESYTVSPSLPRAS